MIKTSIIAAAVIFLTFLGLYHAGHLCDEIDPAKVARSKRDLQQLTHDVSAFRDKRGRLPTRLSEVPLVLGDGERRFRSYDSSYRVEPLDPWSKPYHLEAADAECGFKVVGYGEKTRRRRLEQHRVRFAPVLPKFETADAYFVYFFALLAVPLLLLFLIWARWPRPDRKWPAVLRTLTIVILTDLAAVGTWSLYVQIANFMVRIGDL